MLETEATSPFPMNWMVMKGNSLNAQAYTY